MEGMTSFKVLDSSFASMKSTEKKVLTRNKKVGSYELSKAIECFSGAMTSVSLLLLRVTVFFEGELFGEIGGDLGTRPLEGDLLGEAVRLRPLV